MECDIGSVNDIWYHSLHTHYRAANGPSIRQQEGAVSGQSLCREKKEISMSDLLYTIITSSDSSYILHTNRAVNDNCTKVAYMEIGLKGTFASTVSLLNQFYQLSSQIGRFMIVLLIVNNYQQIVLLNSYKFTVYKLTDRGRKCY